MQLQKQMEAAAKEFAANRKEREREVMQLRKQVTGSRSPASHS